MKITIKNESKSSEIKYPCLMQSPSGATIVFFYRSGCGTVLHGPNVGQYSEEWREESYWKPFTGTVELSND